MKTKIKKYQPGKNANDNSPKKISEPTTNDKMNTSANQKDAYKKTRKRRKIIKWKQYGEKWSDPLVIVTIILAFATFALYREASDEGETSKIAAHAAQKAANVAKQTLDETRNEFEKENFPLLVIGAMTDTISKDNVFHFSYEIVNLGNLYAEISNEKDTVKIGTDSGHITRFLYHAIVYDNAFFNKGYVNKYGFKAGITNDELKGITDGKLNFYVVFNITYTSPILGKSYYLRVLTELGAHGKTYLLSRKFIEL